jgi:hypothetical protein
LKAERNLDCMNPHLIQPTPRVASVTVALHPGFDDKLRRNVRKTKSWTSICLFYVRWNFKQI